MEHKDNVVGHTLLGNEHLFLSVDNKVATLVVLALTGFFYDRTLVHLTKMTELRSDHDRHFSYRNLVVVEQDLFSGDPTVTVCNFLDLHFAEDLCLVREPSDSCCVR